MNNQIYELMNTFEHHIKDIYINPTYKDDTRFHAKHEFNFKYKYDSYNIILQHNRNNSDNSNLTTKIKKPLNYFILKQCLTQDSLNGFFNPQLVQR